MDEFDAAALDSIKVGPGGTPHPIDTDEETKEHTRSLRGIEISSERAYHDQRKTFAERIYWFTAAWQIGLFGMLILAGFKPGGFLMAESAQQP